MRKRRLALFMAVLLAFTSIPTNGWHVHAAEELIVEDASISAELTDEPVVDAGDILLIDDEAEVLLEEISEPVSDASEDIPTDIPADISEESDAEPTAESESEDTISEETVSEEILAEEILLESVEEVAGEGPELLSDETEAWADAEELEVGRSYQVSLGKGESKYFKFTVTDEKAGKYKIYSFDNYVGGMQYDPYVEFYKFENDGLTYLNSCDDSAGDWNFSLGYGLESGVTYYYKMRGNGDAASSFSFKLEQALSVTNVVIVNEGKTNTIISGVDSGYMECQGMLLRITYADDSYEDVQVGRSTSNGDSTTWAVHKIKEDATIGEAVYNYNALSGPYYVVATCGESSVVKTVNYISRSEAVGTNILDLASTASLTLPKTGTTQGVAFTPTVDAEYMFSLSTGGFQGIYDSSSCVSSSSGDQIYCSLTADTTYYIFFSGNNNEAQDITVSVKQRKEITAVSCEPVKEISTFEVFDYLYRFPVTISYGDVTEQETEIEWNIWQHDEPNVLFGVTENADIFKLEVTDENGEAVPLYQSPGVYLTSGEYTAELSVDENSEIAAVTQNITVNWNADSIYSGVPESALLPNGKEKAYKFALDKSGQYTFSSKAYDVNNVETGCPWIIYEVTETGLQSIDTNIYGNYELDASKEYVVIFGTVSYDCRIEFTLNRMAQAEKLETTIQEEYAFDEIKDALVYLPLKITYDNEKTDSISYWWIESVTDDAENSRNVYAASGSISSQRYIMSLRQGDQYADVSSEIPTGEYTLEIYPENNKEICLSKTVKVVGFKDTVALTDGGSWDLTMTNQDMKVFEFTPSEETAGEYTIWSSSDDEDKIDPYVEIYVDADGVISYLDDADDNGSGMNFRLTETLEAGKTYYFRVKKYRSNEESFTVNFKKIPGVKEASFTQEYQKLTFAELEKLTKMSISVTYGNDSTEQVSGWTRDWKNDIRCLMTYSDNGNELWLTMEKKTADNEWQAVDFMKWQSSEGIFSLGEYRLVLSEKSGKTLAAMEFTVTLPEAEQFPLTEIKTVKLSPDKNMVYAFDIAEAGKYSFAKVSDNGYTEMYALFYNAEEGTLLNEISVDSRRSFVLQRNLQAGRYYVVLSGDDATVEQQFQIRKVEKISSIEIAEEDVSKELIQGLDKPSFGTSKAAVVYADGYKETVIPGERTLLGNRVNQKLYGAGENGEPDWTVSYNMNAPIGAGTYFLTAEIEEDDNIYRAYVPIQVISQTEAAKKNEYKADSEKITMVGNEKGYVCVAYTAQTEGWHTFAADTYLKSVTILDAEGNEIKKNWLDDHTARAYLLAETVYTVAMRSKDASEFDVQINPEKKVGQAQITLNDKEYIAGIDAIFDEDILVDVTMENGDVVIAADEKSFAEGAGFYYEIINVDTGEKVNVNSQMNAGTYQITAVQQVGQYRTGGVIYRTGGSIYRTGSSITFEPVRSNTVTVTVKSVDPAALAVIEEEKDVALKANANRQLFSFTPSKSAMYELQAEGYMEWFFYEAGDTGLMRVGNNLTAGKTYILGINKVPVAQTVRVTSDVSRFRVIKNNGTLKLELSAYGDETIVFTPETAGEYIIAAKCVTGEAAFSADVAGTRYIMSSESGEYVNVNKYLEADIPCRIVLRNDSSAAAAFEVSVAKVQEKEAKSLSVAVKDTTGLSAEFAGYYNVKDLFEITVVYADGTSEVVPANNYASTGVSVWAEYQDSYSLNENVERCEYRISYGESIVQYVKVDFNKTPNSYLNLTQDVPASVQIGSQGVKNMVFASFTPETEGEYYFEFPGYEGSYSICEQSRGDYGNENGHFKLVAGREYQFQINTWYAGNRQMQIKVSKCKEVAKLTLLTEADPFIYGLGNMGAGMSAEATYTDGTTAIVGPEYGSVNGLSSEIEVYTVKSGAYRVYLKYGGRRVSCLVNEPDLKSLTTLDMNQLTKVNAEPGDGTYRSVYALFTPEYSGNYDLDIRFEGTLEMNYVYYDVAGRRAEGTPAKLTAGKTYIVWLNLKNEGDTNVQLRPIYLNSACGYGSHTFAYFVYNEDATCTADGTKTAVCEYCNETKTVTAEGTKLDHVFTLYTSNGDATCTADGTETAACTRGCEAEDIRTEEGSKLAHSFGEYASNNDATCTADGTKSAECSYKCGQKHTIRDAGSALGHEFAESAYEYDEKSATCTSDGTETAKCSRCDAVDTRKAENTKISHEFAEYAYDEGSETCTLDGTKTASCSYGCGMTDTQIAENTATGHAYEVTDNVPATCTVDGEKVSTCETCDHVKTEVLSATGHDFEAAEPIPATEEADGKEYEVCKNCQEEVITRVLLQTKKDTEITGLLSGLNDETATDATVDAAVDSVSEMDNTDLVNSTDGMEVISALEEKLTDETTGTVGTTVTDSTDTAIDNVSVAGAAVTVASQIKKNEALKEDETYNAELVISPAATPAPAALTEETVGLNSYTVDIQMNINNSSGETVVSNVQPAAPITITMSVPGGFGNGTFKLYHINNGTAEEVKYTRNGDTITFTAVSLSPWMLVNTSCLQPNGLVQHTLNPEACTVVPATCKAAGSRTGTCTVCFEPDVTEVIPKLDTHGETRTETQNASCFADGYESQVCKVCDEVLGRTIIPKFGSHSWDEGKTTVWPTCISKGNMEKTCVRDGCGAKDNIEISEIPHSYAEEFTVDETPTCTEPGSKSRHCTTEGCTAVTEVTPVAASGHTYAEGEDAYVTETPATCTSEGTEVKICTAEGCGNKAYRRATDMLDHNLVENIIQEATCGTKGSKNQKCTNANCTYETQVTEIPATGNHNYKEERVDATCGTAGSWKKVCQARYCGHEESGVIPATGNHAYKTVVDKAATCGAAGSQHKECTNCDYRGNAETIKATGSHTYKTVVDKAATCTAAGSQHEECKVCGHKQTAKTIPMAAHKYKDNYVVTKEATCLADGVKTRYCTECKGAPQTAAIPKLAGTVTPAASKLTLKVKDTVKASELVSGLMEGDYITNVTTSNKKLVTVKKSGKDWKITGKTVTSKKTGTAKITITLASGASANITFSVQKANVKTSSLKVTNASKKLTLTTGDSLVLETRIKPVTTTDKLTFSTSNKKIVTVSKSGELKAKKAGTATITVKSGKKSVKIKVTVKAPLPTAFKLSKSKLSLKAKKSATLKVKFTPGSSEAKVTFKTSNKKVATVSKTGKVTAKKKGTATITATVKSATGETLTRTCKVTVK